MIEADVIRYLSATVPFITHKTLRECEQFLIDNRYLLAITITKYDYLVLLNLKREESGLVSFVWDEYSSCRSKDLPELLHDLDSVIFFNLNKYGNDASKVGYEISRLYCQDIDTLEDFENAEKLFPILMPNLFLK